MGSSMCSRKQKSVVLVRIIGESMIEVGDLVKYEIPVEHLREKGVWLVVDVEEDFFAQTVTIKQGNRQRYCSRRLLNKISSSR